MNTQRRQFIRNSSLLLAGAAFSSPLNLLSPEARRLTGVQLYSVREDMKKDPVATLTKLAEMGYKHVEHANYIDRKFYGFQAREFRKILDDLGLHMPSGHTVMTRKHWDATAGDFTDTWKYTVEDAAVLGQKFVISPSMEKAMYATYDDLRSTMDLFNKSGELCKKSGMMFGYHNHDFEFSTLLNGETVYDIMLNNTDPNSFMQQLDSGNLYNGGAKAIDVLKKHPGRFMSMHVKDEIPGNADHAKYESTVLGKGIVNIREVIEYGKKYGGTIHFIIEQEAYQGQSPLDAVKEDLKVMKSWGY